MQSDQFPVEWKGRTLFLGQLTADLKKAFAQWVKPRALAESQSWASAPGLTEERRKELSAQFLQYRSQVAGGCIKWTTQPCVEVAMFLNDDGEGDLYYNRLLFGESVKDMGDVELRELIDAKLADPASDYSIAMDLIWETANPKAMPGLQRSPVPAATGILLADLPLSPSDFHAQTPAA